MIDFGKLKQKAPAPGELRRALTFSASGNLQDDLDGAAEEIGCTRSAFVVAAIEDAIAQYRSSKPRNAV